MRRGIILYSGMMVFFSATNAFAQIVHLGSDLPRIGNGPLAALYDKAGFDALTRGSLPEAKANFQNAISVCPFDENAALGAARCAALESDFKSAIKYYQMVIVGHHEEYDIDLQTEYVLVLVQAGQGADAVTLYNHVIDLCKNGRVITPMEITLPVFRTDGSDYDPVRLQAMSHLILAMNSSTSDDKRIASEMQKVTGLAPDSSLVSFYEGVLLSHINKTAAKKAFLRAQSLDNGTNKKTIDKWLTALK